MGQGSQRLREFSSENLLFLKKTVKEHRLKEKKKLVKSINISCRKRPVNPDQIELVANSIQRRLESSGEIEIPQSCWGISYGCIKRIR